MGRRLVGPIIGLCVKSACEHSLCLRVGMWLRGQVSAELGNFGRGSTTALVVCPRYLHWRTWIDMQ